MTLCGMLDSVHLRLLEHVRPSPPVTFIHVDAKDVSLLITQRWKSGNPKHPCS